MVTDINLGDDLESTATSANERWVNLSKDACDGAVNLLDLRKLK